MKNSLLSCLLVGIASTTFAQAPVIQWQKCFGGSNGDEPFSIQQTIDGGYIVAGLTESNDGDIIGFHGGTEDAWIVKIDSVGGLQWQKCLGGSDDEGFSSIVQTNDKGYIAAGSTDSNNGDVSGNHGSDDAWIVKLDSTGAIQWQKCYGGSGVDYFDAIALTSDGGYIAAGATESNDGDVTGNHGGDDYWIVKIDSVGGLLWQKCLGGDETDDAYAIAQTSDEGYIIAGQSDSNNGDVTGNHGSSDDWLVKLDNGGHLEWEKCLGGSSADVANDMQITKDGGFIMTGSTNSTDDDVVGFHPNDLRDYWVVKTDSLGKIINQKCLGGPPAIDAQESYSVRQTIDGGYIVSGQTSSDSGDVSGNHGGDDFWIVKLDTSLSIEWQICLGGSGAEEVPYIKQTNDGGYIVTGYATSNDGEVSGNHGGADYWVVKLSPAPLGVSEYAQPVAKKINIYPNPTEDIINIENIESGQVTIFNVLGEIIYTEELNSKQETVNCKPFPSGVYFVQVSGKTQTAVLKFVKE